MDQEHTQESSIEEDPYYLMTVYFLKTNYPTLTEEVQQKLVEIMMSFVNKQIDFPEASSRYLQMIRNDDIVRQINQSILDGENESLRIEAKTKIGSLRTGRKVIQNWTPTEDNRLLYAIHKYGTSDWNVIADFCANNRNRSQCAQRWNRVLDPRISKSQWTEAEETRLKELVDQYGEKSWKVISDIIGNRTDIQCRYHYKMVMQRKGKNKKKPTSTRIDYGSDDGLPMTRNSFAKQQQQLQQQQQLTEHLPVPQPQPMSQTMQPTAISQLASINSMGGAQPYPTQQFLAQFPQQPAQMMVMPQTTQIPPAMPQPAAVGPMQSNMAPPPSTSPQNGAYSVPFNLKDLLSNNSLSTDSKQPMDSEMSWLSTIEQKPSAKVIDEY